MHYVFVGILIISIFVLLIELSLIIGRITSKEHSTIMLFILASLINNVGYLLEITSDSLETAIMGTRICYVGKSYLIFLAFLYTMRLCRITVPRLVRGAAISFHTLILLLVFFSDHTPLYYSSIEFVDEGTFSHLVLGHGPFYYLNFLSIGIYIIAMLIASIRKLRSSNSKGERRQLGFLLGIILVNFVSTLLFIFNLSFGYDSTAIGYFISSIILFFAIFRYHMFDVILIAKDHALENLSSGLVVLDNNGFLLYSNKAATTLYPDLDTPKASVAVDAIRKLCKEEQNLFSENRVYSVSSQDIVNNSEVRGTMYTIRDVTDDYHYTERLKHDVETKTHEIEKIQHSIIASFANMVEARDGATGLHIRNTSLYVAIVAKALQGRHTYEDILSDKYVNTLIEAAPLHDIGKIAISDTILLKPGKLTDEEFNIMKSHSAIGAQMIEDALSEVEDNDYLKMAKDMAHYHHERWDGTGYPNKLKGEEIPLCARIMAIADVYDALRSNRCYKEGFSKEKSLQIIRESSGTHFDPAIVDVFVDNIVAIEQV